MSDEVSLMVTTEGLTALAEMALSTKSQTRLDELLAKNADGKLSADETMELDLLLTQVDELNLVKARAAATLHRIRN
jgi:5-methylcytosine-specific restriction endonuclease McrA